MSRLDEHNNYQTDCANDDRYMAISLMPIPEIMNELEERGDLTEEEIDVPIKEFKYSDDELIRMLYDTDFNPFS
jgi:hypothetical protein